MARPMRIEYPGAVYHITSRGNERNKIFLNDRDREIFLNKLGLVTV
jgi:putative transposase